MPGYRNLASDGSSADDSEFAQPKAAAAAADKDPQYAPAASQGDDDASMALSLECEPDFDAGDGNGTSARSMRSGSCRADATLRKSSRKRGAPDAAGALSRQRSPVVAAMSAGQGSEEEPEWLGVGLDHEEDFPLGVRVPREKVAALQMCDTATSPAPRRHVPGVEPASQRETLASAAEWRQRCVAS